MTEQTYTVTFRFDDGIEQIVEVDKKYPLLHQALEQGVSLVHQCRSGSCGTCEVQLLDGDVVMSAKSSVALTPNEISLGSRLICSSYAQSDALVALPYSSDLIYGPAAKLWHATVVDVVNMSTSVALLRLSIEEKGFRFRSGQYSRLHIPKTDEWRSYSMATTESDLPLVDFLVRLLPDGTMSDYLRQGWNKGDSIELEGPMGSFYLRDGGSNLIMLAGGTGLAPILSILDQTRSTRRPAPKILLCFGSASEDELFYLDELELREFWMPSLQVRISCDRPSPSWEGIVGNPLSTLSDVDLSDPDTVVYVCGPPPMIEAAHQQLSIRKPGIQIYNEQFRPSSI